MMDLGKIDARTIRGSHRMRKPKFYRSPNAHRISWEVYSWACWYITISISRLEFQFNKWGKLK